ncbi:MAG: alpha-E domain-containing protein [Gammaproteobacteria bacterium]|nr:alpha-E domain-containing protein [Gammaproteobacteria bacterium]
MLSRVANSIYWLGRYVERAENTARLINVNSHLLMDLPKRVRLGWAPIIDIFGTNHEFYDHYTEADERSVLRFLTSNLNNPSSILSSLSHARENARTIRDIIPREVGEKINENFIYAREHVNEALTQRGRFEYMRNIITGSQTLTGMLAGTMTHDEGYSFLRMGRNLERADMTTRIIDVRSATLLPTDNEELTPFENIQWVSVLKSMTAYQMYRRAMRLQVRRPDVLRFLFQNRVFPRSVYHASCEVEDCINHLPRSEKSLKTLKSLQKKLLKAKPEELRQEQLHEFIDELQLGLASVNGEITANYF